ncbi:hypothetical protein [Sporosarcina sp. G11-34]|uniref:hypothetical protein n=1 Tax=Sporosarcina sp. G11-34 TaxID=2849605 RepID=UPI0022A91EC6|nr:hypothetical protein [Sporosarcina sp. G11-34]MCZ2258607.1 hypothetical protein [Sporosarcina sp. G11-34]
MQLNELLNIYKDVFSMKSGYEKIIKLHKVVRILLIIAGLMGIAVIISGIFFVKYIFLAIVAYLASSIIITLVIRSILKREYNDINYLEKKSNAEFIERISSALYLDFGDEKVLNTIGDYLNFHWKKEKDKLSFLTLFKPMITWVIFILPILFTYFIEEIDLESMYLLTVLSLYILGFLFISNAIFMEVDNKSKHNTIKSVLGILNEQKMFILRKELAIDEIEKLLINRDYKSLSQKILNEAGFHNIIKQNVSHYISSLNSIKGVTCKKRLQEVINDCNQIIKKNTGLKE